ncbi:hypothetical protein SNOG_00154 [Parastagonospora nodorum SN15]|uniref:Carboxylic ester hydrolase n=1 Tax=Phaeosphaeria nodorum (strain SN15 / ATCC MYA-4574 / FGSC 10173) TaxID=321614 RepID=Q0V760_PHANO|nr:hypothetical protein SNOG_00154 [Parastagonospora nodorum SN15]EAT91649.2 hypothetical protein SNOG_00154 [Parastagonospora nodorum SN15]
MNVSSIPASVCAESAIPYPMVFGAEILNLSANLVQNYSQELSDQYLFDSPPISVRNIDYCNITVTYTHPGQNDTINVEKWLPMKNWNGRLQAVGGGGWLAGRFDVSYAAMARALGNGYVATTTDAGIELIKEFYGQPAEYSYWSGCSQGGRQGMMLAQRYPEAYDGIAASAPALNWARLIPALAWPQVMMEVLGQFPPKCELDALTAGAIATCDSQDDVTDGIISDPDACSFDPFSMVGKIVNCNNETTTISNAAATIANLTWTGPRKARMPTGLGEAWLKFMVKKDPDWDFSKIASVEEYARLFKASVQEFESIIGTFDTDLSTFRDAGGKMITFHGMADTVIPRQGTNEYYTRATEQTPDIKDFFRYFEVPGLGHCNGGVGGQPTATFQALVDWVEKGVRPDTLPINFKDTNGTQYERILCPYPEKTRLVSADLDTTKAESYKCAL